MLENVDTVIRRMARGLSRSPGPASAVLFFALGCIVLGYPGLQADEVVFASAFFGTRQFFNLQIGSYRIPVMLMSYAGALKTWLYAPLLWVLHPGVVLIRMPAVVIGAVTVYLVAALLERVHSRQAAWIGSLLLGTDAVFLLTTTFDWGPVALQHVFLAAVLLLAVCWFQDPQNDLYIAGASLCCGLGLWDKATFIWPFLGLLAGSLLWAPEVRRLVNWRRGLIALSMLCVGALPLITYNAAGKLATVRNPVATAGGVLWKLQMLENTWNGSALFGYLVYAPTAVVRNRVIEAAFLLAIAMLVFTSRAKKALLFCSVAMLLSWVLMLLSGGGGAVHHTVLLWPLPHIFVATALAELPVSRRTLGSTAVLLIGVNLLVMGEYIQAFAKYGQPGSWSDAIDSLYTGLQNTPASTIIIGDWGILDPLAVLSKGRLAIRNAPDVFLHEERPALSQKDLQILLDPQATWVVHTRDFEQFQGAADRIGKAGSRSGLSAVSVRTYNDRHGRVVFETFRLARH